MKNLIIIFFCILSFSANSQSINLNSILFSFQYNGEGVDTLSSSEISKHNYINLDAIYKGGDIKISHEDNCSIYVQIKHSTWVYLYNLFPGDDDIQDRSII